MSYTVSHPAVGTIRLIGLEYALSYIDEVYLAEIIFMYFQSHGMRIDNLQDCLYIRFTLENPPLIDDDGILIPAWGFFSPIDGWIADVAIYMQKIHSVWDLITVLLHELDHCLWLLEGKYFDNTLPYRQRPHEVRAYSRVPEWVTHFLEFHAQKSA